MSLPVELDYSARDNYLDEDTMMTNCIATPVNGSTFTAGGGPIYFDLLKQDFLDGQSMCIRGFMTLAGGTASYMTGIPAFSPFLTSQVCAGSIPFETTFGYNQIMQTVYDLTYSSNQLMGSEYSLGFAQSDSGADYNGRSCAIGASIPFAVPLYNCLSRAEKMIPLFAIPQIRVVLTLDSLANIFLSTASPTSLTLSNLELSYELTRCTKLQNAILQSNQKLYIRTLCLASTTTQQIGASTAAGTQTLSFNVNYNSIRALILKFVAGITSTNTHGVYNSWDISSGGNYQFLVGGHSYPNSKYLSAGTTSASAGSKAGILMELKKVSCCLDKNYLNVFDKSRCMNISAESFTQSLDATTVAATRSKFMVGVHLERSRSNLWSGISSNNTAIQVRVDTLASTGALAYTPTLIVINDGLLEIDVASNQINLKV